MGNYIHYHTFLYDSVTIIFVLQLWAYAEMADCCSEYNLSVLCSITMA